jgi:L-threonylcarbamoyladenylate synthase
MINEKLLLIMNNQIQQAIMILKQGGIVIFPTDTAFGIGCRMDDEAAVKKLLRIRKRPATQATLVLVSSVAMAQKYLLPIPEKVKHELMERYFPGALTIILPALLPNVSSLLLGGGKTLGVRMPDYQLAMIEKVGVPILGPSANFRGEKTPYTFEELDPALIKLVDYVVPGFCPLKQVSTVIDCSVTPWKIVRKGSITDAITVSS